jgi:hypothetical protein
MLGVRPLRRLFQGSTQVEHAQDEADECLSSQIHGIGDRLADVVRPDHKAIRALRVTTECTTWHTEGHCTGVSSVADRFEQLWIRPQVEADKFAPAIHRFDVANGKTRLLFLRVWGERDGSTQGVVRPVVVWNRGVLLFSVVQRQEPHPRLCTIEPIRPKDGSREAAKLLPRHFVATAEKGLEQIQSLSVPLDLDLKIPSDVLCRMVKTVRQFLLATVQAVNKSARKAKQQ